MTAKPLSVSAILALLIGLLTPLLPAGAAAARTAEPILDPGAVASSTKVKRLTVDNGLGVVDVGFPALVEDLAEVTYPRQRRGGAPMPVVLFLHGQHAPCYQDDSNPRRGPSWCAGFGNTLVPSYLGYRYLADALAKRGNIVVSVSADGVNAQANQESEIEMSARAALVEYHLEALRRAGERGAPGYGRRLVGRVDVSNVVLMGHSRGGEGVIRAAQVINGAAGTPIQIAGVVPFAPVNNNQQALGSVPTITLLPACDGDVSDQVGQTYVDRSRDLYPKGSALQSSVWIPGANHNYFNTEWTPRLSVSRTGADDATYVYGDSPSSGSCRDGRRLRPAVQRAVGKAYLTAAVTHLRDATPNLLKYFDGSGPVPRQVADRGVAARSAAIGDPYGLALVPESGTKVVSQRVRAKLCPGSALMDDVAGTQPPVCATGVVDPDQDTAWLGPPSWLLPGLPMRTAIKLNWSRRGYALARLPERMDLTTGADLRARVVVAPATRGSVGLAFRDASGRTRSFASEGPRPRALTWGKKANRLWPQSLSLSTARLARAGLDPRRITHVGLSTRGRGEAWLIDASVSGRSKSSVAMLPAASVADRSYTVPAGQSTTVQAQIRLDAPAPRGARFRVQVADLDGNADRIKGMDRTFRVRPGSRFRQVPIRVTMPARAGADDVFDAQISIYGLTRLDVGDSQALLSFRPQGAIIRQASVVQPQVTAAPGGQLDWDFDISGDDGSDGIGLVAKSTGGTLTWEDLDQTWLRQQVGPGQTIPTGPIADGIALSASRVVPGTWRIDLPLSTQAVPDRYLELDIVDVTGASYPQRPSLMGTVRSQ